MDPTFTESKSLGFGIGVGVKYYWTPASKFSLSIGGKLSYDSVKIDEEVTPGIIDPKDSSSITSKVIGLSVPVGLHYFVSDSFAIITTWGGFGYSTNDNGGDGADKTDSLSLGLNLSSVNFGLIYKP